MSLRVTFELSESDLKHFRLIISATRKRICLLAPENIVAKAEQLLDRIDPSRMPEFVLERLFRLRVLIRMLSDIDWRLSHADAQRVLSALAYFTESEDLIPDHVPGLGFLDDAIMIELLVRELRHEIEAYEDFCVFRTDHLASKKRNKQRSRDLWLEKRREELQFRMQQRRNDDAGRGKNGEPGLFDPDP